MANSHRRRNFIGDLEVDGMLLTEVEDIRGSIVWFNNALYKEDAEVLHFPSIDEVERGWLEREFDREEVFNAAKGMRGDKALSPNGFTMTYFQQCWDNVEEDVLAFFQEVFSYCSSEKSLNATFINLILRKTRSRKFKRFSTHYFV
jgi:hypothetical protein